MADYYNVTRAPLGIALRRGGSVSVAPKSWLFISPQDEGTAGLAEAVRKGFLVRSLVPITDTSAPANPAAATESVTPAPVAAAEPSVTPVPEDATTSVSKADPKPESAGLSAPVIESKQSRRNK